MPNGDNPHLSVCIPTYEPKPSYLRDLLDSLAAQECPNVEVLVSDDASQVNVEAIVSEYGDALSVRFLRNDENLGMVGNWNRAVRASHGELAMVVGQDDVLLEGTLKAYLREFQAPSTIMCSSAREFIDSEGTRIRPRLFVNDRNSIFISRERYELAEDQLRYLCLRNGNVFGEPSAVMYRRTIFDEIGGYDSSFRHAADLDFNLRAARHGRAIYLRRPGIKRRRHSESLTEKNRGMGAISEDRLRVYLRHSADIVDRTQMVRIHADMAWKYLLDAIRNMRAGLLGQTYESLKLARRFGDAPLWALLERGREVVLGRSIDAQ